MGETTIEWTNKTWNPVTGCTKISAGCKNCYAERVFPRTVAGQLTYVASGRPVLKELADAGLVYEETRSRKFTDVRCHPDRLEQPLHWRKPQRIFVNSMSDLFHEDVPDDFIASVLAVMERTQQHIYQILTKRHERMNYRICTLARTFGVLPNVWLGVSCEDQKTADERIPVLLQTPAAIRFVSYEPALGPVDFRDYLDCGSALTAKGWTANPALDWVIAGSESGPKARGYETEWFANVARHCEQADVAFFMKQLTINGRKIPFEEWLGYLKVREFPEWPPASTKTNRAPFVTN